MTKLFFKAPPAPAPKKVIRDHFGGQLPSNIPPSTYIRRWDSALMSSLFVGGGCFVATHLLWAFFYPIQTVLFNALASLKTLLYLGTLSTSQSEFIHEFYQGRSITFFAERAAALGTCLTSAALVFKSSLKPTNGVSHVHGQRHIQGVEAVAEFQHQAKKLGVTKKNAFMKFHPAAYWPAEPWKKGILVEGGIGSGKTVVLLYWLEQIMHGGPDGRGYKCFLYDVKGDFASYFPQAKILSPFHEHSSIWNIAEDIRSVLQSRAFAQSFIPKETGKDSFWITGAQMMLDGCLRALLTEKPRRWGFADLNHITSLGREELHAVLLSHYPKAARLIEDDNQTSMSLMQTFSNCTRTIELLAQAWPQPVKGRCISLTKWCQDDYKGPRQLIVQAGEDEELTNAVIAAMVNVCASAILSPTVADNESGRHIFFVLDEFSSLNPINLKLLDKGRSRGCCLILAYQSRTLLADKYGENLAKAIGSMVGTQVLFRIQAGPTRQEVISHMGQNRVAVSAYNVSGGFNDGIAISSSVNEEARDVLTPSDVTDLGPVKVNGQFHGIKALVIRDGHLLEMLWPGTIKTRYREGQVPAMWTLPADQLGVPVTLKKSTALAPLALEPAVEVNEHETFLPAQKIHANTLGPMREPKPRVTKTVTVPVESAEPEVEQDTGEREANDMLQDALLSHFGGDALVDMVKAVTTPDELSGNRKSVWDVGRERTK